MTYRVYFVIQGNYKFRIKEIPIPTRYFKNASTINFYQSLVYGLGIVFLLGEYAAANIIWERK